MSETAQMPTRNSWQPIETLTKHRDRKVDLWVKWWRADTDTFDGRRYTNCYWSEDFKSWRSLDTSDGLLATNVRVTHWRDMPLSPEKELGEKVKVDTAQLIEDCRLDRN